jgi:hypothetical protein
MIYEFILVALSFVHTKTNFLFIMHKVLLYFYVSVCQSVLEFLSLFSLSPSFLIKFFSFFHTFYAAFAFLLSPAAAVLCCGIFYDNMILNHTHVWRMHTHTEAAAVLILE